MVRRRGRWNFESREDVSELVGQVNDFARSLREEMDLDPLLERIGNATHVLLGEASHGTSEYYSWRTRISRRLIEEKGFSFIAVEGDWPDCYRVNRYIRGFADAGQTARDVLHSFERWPTWMWANEEIVELVEWLREHNAGRPGDQQVGFYGLDVYSLWDSLHQVLGYLRREHPDMLDSASKAFACFEPYGEDVQEYAQTTRWVERSCEDEVIALLRDVRHLEDRFPSDGSEAQFNAEQNSLVVRNAEHYYRTMIQGGPESWNIRDSHMTETLGRLMHRHRHAKAIVWEHNTHIGDARYTDMQADGMVNVGQLVRESHSPDDVVLVGFGSHRGTVIAGRAWEAPMQRMPVPAAKPSTWEDVLHQAGERDRLLIFEPQHRTGLLAAPRGHRAIGVVYHPDHEYGNYVPTVLPRRYDAFLFLDETHALHPLHEVLPQEEHEVPETFPFGV